MRTFTSGCKSSPAEPEAGISVWMSLCVSPDWFNKLGEQQTGRAPASEVWWSLDKVGNIPENQLDKQQQPQQRNE